MAALNDRDRRLSGAEHTDVLILRCGISQCAAIGFCGVLFVRSDDKASQTSEWRVAATFALLDLVAVKRFAVAGDQRAHDGVLRLMRLQIAQAPPLLASSAADHLVQQLECT